MKTKEIKHPTFEHFIVTNREVTTSPKNKNAYIKVNEDEHLRVDGRELASENLRFGSIKYDAGDETFQVSILEENDIESFEADMDNKTLPSYQFCRSLFNCMKAEDQGQGEVLVFVHGYKADLDVALDTVKKLHDRYVDNEDSPINKIVLFTWPAMSKILKYRNDARDAKASGYALARSIRKVQAFLTETLKHEDDCKQRIHLMAHSMGNRVLEAMMEELSDADEDRLNSLFSEVILVGADVAYDALERPNPMYDLIDICDRIHVFYHRRDRALGISETTKNAFNRLGKHGIKDSNGIPDDVFEYDITHAKDDLGNAFDDIVNHWSYYSSQEAVDMIVDVLTDFEEDYNE